MQPADKDILRLPASPLCLYLYLFPSFSSSFPQTVGAHFKLEIPVTLFRLLLSQSFVEAVEKLEVQLTLSLVKRQREQ
jgi:hypothetical protein